MKQIITLCLLPFLALAQKETATKVVESKIENVTVYESGAQVTRAFKTPLAVGRTQLIVRGVSPQLDKQSIQAQADGNFVIVSVVLQNSFLSDKSKTDENTKLNTQKQDLEDKILTERAMLNVFKQEELMLSKNQEINGRTSVLKALDLKEAVDFHRNRLTEVLTKQLEINRNIKKIEGDILQLNSKLSQLAPAQENNVSEVLITVSAKEAIAQTNINLSYFVPNAGWTPTYDLRAIDIAHDLELGYKANVYQYSGEDWTNVKLTLSTANPRKSGQAPALKMWYWGQTNNYNDYYNNVNTTINGTDNEVVGTVRSLSDKQPLPGVTIALKGTSLGTQTDANGNYRLTLPPNLKNVPKKLVFMFVGMISEERDVRGGELNVELRDDVKQLEEAVVVGYSVQKRTEVTGSVSSLMQGKASGVSIRGASTLKNSVALLEVEENDAPTSQSFEVKLPYSIASDGKVYTVEIKTETIPAYYEHYCVPKIDKDVFLNAKIVGWEKYGLLAGEINLFFEGTFIGKSELKLPDSDTLLLSLGRDKSVLVNRTKQKEFTKKQFLGNNKTESRAYQISVRNTKKLPINIVIKEQFPISYTKEIEIMNQLAPEAEVVSELGMISWTIKLEPAQEKKLNFSYSVKYPKSGFVSTE